MYQKRVRLDNVKATALITGASSGVGYHYSCQLAEKGYNLVLVSNEEQALNNVADEISKKYSVTTFPVCMDLTSFDAAKKLYEYCQINDLEIEILINNAGFLVFDELHYLNENKASGIIMLSNLTPTMLCKYFGSDMKNRGHGHILIMSSLGAWLPYPGLMLYAATKRYLKTFGKAYHYEMIDYGVSVTTVCPGAINTRLVTIGDKLRKIALNLGVMMNPDKLAKKALRAMFHNKVCIVPGFINKIAVPIVSVFPMFLVQVIKRRTKLLERK